MLGEANGEQKIKTQQQMGAAVTKEINANNNIEKDRFPFLYTNA